MKHLVAAAIAQVVDGASVVLHVDPVRDDHGSSHDEFQHAAIGIALVFVIVQEGAALQIDSARTRTRCDDESGIIRQPPFRAGLRPVVGSRFDRSGERLGL